MVEIEKESRWHTKCLKCNSNLNFSKDDLIVVKTTNIGLKTSNIECFIKCPCCEAEIPVWLDIITQEPVTEGFLVDWYINSVVPTDEPVWTEEHIKELCKDFIIIPRRTDE